MFFRGQDHIMYQLGDILPYLNENKQSGIALLFRGKSGYGKTEIARRCCNYLVGRNYSECLGNRFIFNEKIWVHFVDEIHLMENPEILYPLIDTGKYVFIFATNYDSEVPEALANRCRSFIFSNYSENDLIDIFRSHTNLNISEAVIRHIITISNGNPRIMIKTFLQNLEMRYSKRHRELEEMSDFALIEDIDKIHGIKDELDVISRQYLDVLDKLGGRASINLLSVTANLDINTIKYYIEPALLFRGLIKITSKGRELCR